MLVDGLPDDAEPTTSAYSNPFAPQSAVETSLYVDEAFSTCPTFDLEKLSTISNTRLNMAKDHFSQLQTDLAHMRRYVLVIQQSEYSRFPEQGTYAMTTWQLPSTPLERPPRQSLSPKS